MCLILYLFDGWLFRRKERSAGKQKGKCKESQEKTKQTETNKIYQQDLRGTQHYGSNILREEFTISSHREFKNKNIKEEQETIMSQQQKLSGNEKQSQDAGGEEIKTTTNIQDSDSNSQVATSGGQSEAVEFRIRTLERRHLDFDGQYDLEDVNAQDRSKWSGPFHFIQAADSQLGMIDSYVYNRTEPGWEEEIKLCEQLVQICNHMEPKPKFMIICGDLVDAWPGTEIRRQQVVDFKRIFAKLDHKIPLVCVCGNHDVGDEPTMSGIEEYRRNFGDDYFYFTTNDVLFIVINSQFYQHREFVKDYASKQDEWLESILAKCKLFKYSIVFEHIPWFLQHSDEENDYFNIKKEVRLTWLRKFKDAGVTKIMCGHYHRNAGGWFEDMELVVTSAIGAQCGNDKSGVRIVKVLEKTIEHQYYAMQDIPHQVALT